MRTQASLEPTVDARSVASDGTETSTQKDDRRDPYDKRWNPHASTFVAALITAVDRGVVTRELKKEAQKRTKELMAARRREKKARVAKEAS